MTDDPVLSIVDLNLCYDEKTVVRDFNLSVAQGAFISLLGPSGCGKTTILRAIAGFLQAKSGRILLDGKDITTLPPERRNIGIVFQNYALFPTMTAFENIAFGLRVAGLSETEIKSKVGQIAEISGIAQHLGKKPANLSGGQQQRVAIARALITGSRVLLFDEPLSNLDAQVRLTMRHEIKRLQKSMGFTAIFVTHDQEEALSLSDTIVVLNSGKTEQIGTARDLYDRPATPFVAGFIGAVNELSPSIAARLVGIETGRCFVKHEHLLLADRGVAARVEHVEFLGPLTRLDFSLDGYALSSLRFGGEVPSVGDEVQLAVREGSAHVFGGATS
jgi:putative spermidine/putrescine transport system ATP-binding protein